MTRADTKARWNVQREIYLRKKIRTLRKAQSLHSLLIPHPQLYLLPFTAEEKARLSVYEEEFQCLDTQYAERKHYMCSWKAGCRYTPWVGI